MKKFIFIWFVSLFGYTLSAQVYNNEWINYSSTYYKFTVGKTGLYRINQNVLAAAGIANIPAEQFQMWRNGKQVALYTSVSSGIIPNNGYIEFFGVKKMMVSRIKDLYKKFSQPIIRCTEP